MADHYTTLDANGSNIGPIGKITTSTVQMSPKDVGSSLPSLDAKPVLAKIAKAKKGLKPLDKWNREVQAKRNAERQPKGNGLACPSCGNELVDSTPGQSISDNMGYSTRTYVNCSKCPFQSFREC